MSNVLSGYEPDEMSGFLRVLRRVAKRSQVSIEPDTKKRRNPEGSRLNILLNLLDYLGAGVGFEPTTFKL